MSLEKEVRENLRRTKIRQAILGSLQFAGIIAVTVLAPNALSLLGKTRTRSGLNSAKSAIQRLADAGLIAYETNSNGARVKLTEKGRHYLKVNLGVHTTPRAWDGKWRVVIFDIPER